MFKHKIDRQEMPRIKHKQTNRQDKIRFSDCAILLEIVDLVWNTLDKMYKTMQNHQRLSKSTEISSII